MFSLVRLSRLSGIRKVSTQPSSTLDVDWQSDNFTLEKWVPFLRDLGADEAARRTLFLLLQHGEDGKRAANEVVGKCLKKIADQEHVNNWSGFIHRSCLSARHNINNQQSPWS